MFGNVNKEFLLVTVERCRRKMFSYKIDNIDTREVMQGRIIEGKLCKE